MYSVCQTVLQVSSFTMVINHPFFLRRRVSLFHSHPISLCSAEILLGGDKGPPDKVSSLFICVVWRER